MRLTEHKLRTMHHIYIYMYIYIKFIREATESAQPDWELDVQQRSYFVLIHEVASLLYMYIYIYIYICIYIYMYI